MSNKSYCISLANVSKTYKLYSSAKENFLDVLGWYKFRNQPSPANYFHSLKNININIAKGESIGIIGQNGAGKSTLLKLITQNFSPSAGEVTIRGSVQALMSTGLGFHPELSGSENIKNSLVFSNIPESELDKAYEEIVDFCELGDFIKQPVRTYSLGMTSRLQFACATAIRPEVLIVDEVLGAGDAYFAGKSASRMNKLIKGNDCTLLLVSHSMQQILQFCEKAIWIEAGEIASQGDALTVIKEYEQFISMKSKATVLASENANDSTSHQNDVTEEAEKIGEQQNKFYQTVLRDNNLVSRWSTIPGLKISKVDFYDEHDLPRATFNSVSSLQVKLQFVAEESKDFKFKAVLILFSVSGIIISRYISDEKSIAMEKGGEGEIYLNFPKITLGNGEFIVSVALYKSLDLDDMNSAEAYDLLSRSFKIIVKAKREDDPSLVAIPADWSEPSLSEVMAPVEKVSGHI